MRNVHVTIFKPTNAISLAKERQARERAGALGFVRTVFTLSESLRGVREDARSRPVPRSNHDFARSRITLRDHDDDVVARTQGADSLAERCRGLPPDGAVASEDQPVAHADHGDARRRGRGTVRVPAFIHNLLGLPPPTSIEEVEKVTKEVTVSTSRLADALERIAESDDPFEDFARRARSAKWQ